MEFRPLTKNESDLVERLLSAKFKGQEAIRQQLQSASVKQIDGDGSLNFQVQDGPLAHTNFRIPVEGEFEDVDGVTIHVLLHVLNGFVNELEIYKEDGSSVARMPEPEDLRIFVPE